MARKKLTPTEQDAQTFDEVAEEIVFESEFLALATEHPHTTNEIQGAVKLTMLAALDKIRDRLKQQNPDGHMVRDILPHAIYIEPGLAGTFRYVLDEMPKSKGGARVLDSIQKHADRGEVPPRYPHPAKEYMQRWRRVFVMAGSTVPELPPDDPEEEVAKRIADLIEAEWTPRVVRELLQLACSNIDTFSAELPETNTDPDFVFGAGRKITPEDVRRELPAMLRKIGKWWLADWQGTELREPDEKGGGES